MQIPPRTRSYVQCWTKLLKNEVYVLPPKTTKYSKCKREFFRKSGEFWSIYEPEATRKLYEPMDASVNACVATPKQPSELVKKTRRGFGTKNLRNKTFETHSLTLVGTNANGLNPKRQSLFRIINRFRPSIITIQETMLSYYGLIKLPGYQVFENLWEESKGGGLLTAVVLELNPVLIASHDDTEILVVEIDIKGTKMRVINCYGPQEDEESHIIDQFWQSLEAEIIKCKDLRQIEKLLLFFASTGTPDRSAG